MLLKKLRDWQTQLKKDLKKVDVAINSVKCRAKEMSSITVNPSIGLDLFTQRCIEKPTLTEISGVDTVVP